MLIKRTGVVILFLLTAVVFTIRASSEQDLVRADGNHGAELDSDISRRLSIRGDGLSQIPERPGSKPIESGSFRPHRGSYSVENEVLSADASSSPLPAEREATIQFSDSPIQQLAGKRRAAHPELSVNKWKLQGPKVLLFETKNEVIEGEWRFSPIFGRDTTNLPSTPWGYRKLVAYRVVDVTSGDPVPLAGVRVFEWVEHIGGEQAEIGTGVGRTNADGVFVDAWQMETDTAPSLEFVSAYRQRIFVEGTLMLTVGLIFGPTNVMWSQ
jgi:hypothetical protein